MPGRLTDHVTHRCMVTQQFVIHIAREAIFTILLVSGPMLGLAMFVGLLIGIFQAVTSINEMTLTFIPKIVIVMTAIVVFAPWMINILLTYTINIFNTIPMIAK